MLLVILGELLKLTPHHLILTILSPATTHLMMTGQVYRHHLPSKEEAQESRRLIHQYTTEILSIETELTVLSNAKENWLTEWQQRREAEHRAIEKRFGLEKDIYIQTAEQKSSVASERITATTSLMEEECAFIAPIRRLPPEILSIIFCVLKGDEGSVDDITAFDYITTVMQVCSLWRSTAISTPALWTEIYLIDNHRDLSHEAAMSRLAMLMNRSRDSLVDVKWNDQRYRGNYQEEDVVSLLQSFMKGVPIMRWRSLEITLSFAPPPEVFETISGSFSELKSLFVQSPFDSGNHLFNLAFDTAVVLEHLELTGCTSAFRQQYGSFGRPLISLQTFADDLSSAHYLDSLVKLSLDQVPTQMVELNSLETLVISRCDVAHLNNLQLPNITTLWTITLIGNDNSTPVSLPKLRFIRAAFCHLQPFKCLSAPSLQRLELGDGEGIMSSLVTSTRSLGRLNEIPQPQTLLLHSIIGSSTLLNVLLRQTNVVELSLLLNEDATRTRQIAKILVETVKKDNATICRLCPRLETLTFIMYYGCYYDGDSNGDAEEEKLWYTLDRILKHRKRFSPIKEVIYVGPQGQIKAFQRD